MKNNCHKCRHMQEIPGDAHISCSKPDKFMQGNPHGIRSGWFNYPWNFDPTWMEKKCRNFRRTNEPS